MFFISFGILNEFIGPVNKILIRNYKLFVNEIFDKHSS